MMRLLRLLSLVLLMGSSACGQGISQLTDGPGSDTEAAWSPDGTQIAFQRELDGDTDLLLLDLATGETRPLVAGPGYACFPAWSPDGQWIAYAFAHFTSTIAQGIDNGYNLFLVPADGGEPRRLTSGLVRDYCPTFAPDGRSICFSSTRAAENSSVALWQVPLAGGEPELVYGRDVADTAFVQPTFSPDGSVICCGFIAGFRANWALRLIRPDRAAEYSLTDPDFPLYGPRWSPDGSSIVCTGYRPGDDGWGVFLIQTDTGRLLRPNTGPGNSRSPAWSPDGSEIVFENDRSGRYQLYRLPLPRTDFPRPAETPMHGRVVALTFGDDPGDTVPDTSGHGNDGRVVGEVGWRGGATFGNGQYVTIPDPKPCDVGVGSFTVKVTVTVPDHTGQLRLICVGDYPAHHQAWQVFLNEQNLAHFNARSPDGLYVGARSDEPLPVGREVTLVGIRHAWGRVELYIDGLRQAATGAGAMMDLRTPTQFRIGAQWNGDAPFVGTVHEFEFHIDALSREVIHGDFLKRFLAP